MISYKSFQSLRDIVMKLVNKHDREDAVNNNCYYISSDTILVPNDEHKINIINGIKENDKIVFNSNKDCAIYIYNSNTTNITVDDNAIILEKYSVNLLECSKINGDWFIKVFPYSKDLLKGLTVLYNAPSLIYEEYNEYALTTLPDLSGNNNNLPVAKAIANTKSLYDYGYSGKTKLAFPYIRFDVSSTEIDTSTISLNNFDSTKSFTMILSGFTIGNDSTIKPIFQLGDKNTIDSGIIGKKNEDGTKFTIHVKDINGVEKSIELERHAGGYGNLLFIEYNSEAKTLKIYDNYSEVLSATDFEFDSFSDLILGNGFGNTNDSKYYCRYFAMWNRVLTEAEYNKVKSIIGERY